jgi:hypothetical protein
MMLQGVWQEVESIDLTYAGSRTVHMWKLTNYVQKYFRYTL